MSQLNLPELSQLSLALYTSQCPRDVFSWRTIHDTGCQHLKCPVTCSHNVSRDTGLTHTLSHDTCLRCVAFFFSIFPDPHRMVYLYFSLAHKAAFSTYVSMLHSAAARSRTHSLHITRGAHPLHPTWTCKASQLVIPTRGLIMAAARSSLAHVTDDRYYTWRHSISRRPFVVPSNMIFWDFVRMPNPQRARGPYCYCRRMATSRKNTTFSARFGSRRAPPSLGHDEAAAATYAAVSATACNARSSEPSQAFCVSVKPSGGEKSYHAR